MAPTARRISAPTLAADASFGMANVTLSNDSLNFLQKHRHFNNSSTSQSRDARPFVSFVRHSDDSSDSDSSSVVMTPKLRQHQVGPDTIKRLASRLRHAEAEGEREPPPMAEEPPPPPPPARVRSSRRPPRRDVNKVSVEEPQIVKKRSRKPTKVEPATGNVDQIIEDVVKATGSGRRDRTKSSERQPSAKSSAAPLQAAEGRPRRPKRVAEPLISNHLKPLLDSPSSDVDDGGVGGGGGGVVEDDSALTTDGDFEAPATARMPTPLASLRARLYDTASQSDDDDESDQSHFETAPPPVPAKTPTKSVATPRSILKAGEGGVATLATLTSLEIVSPRHHQRSATVTSFELVASPKNRKTTSRMTSFELPGVHANREPSGVARKATAAAAPEPMTSLPRQPMRELNAPPPTPPSPPPQDTPRSAPPTQVSSAPTTGGVKRKAPVNLRRSAASHLMDAKRHCRPSPSTQVVVVENRNASVGSGGETAVRLNPYLAAADDPLSTRQLMLTDRYRVLWLELLPECFFSLRTQCPTTVVLVAGTVNIRGGCEAHALDQTNRTVDLERGVLYHLFNGGHLVARYQLIETLPTAPSS